MELGLQVMIADCDCLVIFKVLAVVMFLRHVSLFKGENEEKSPGHIKKSLSLLYNE
jgi:hypothetical protein